MLILLCRCYEVQTVRFFSEALGLVYEHARSLYISNLSYFPKLYPNPNECMHERRESTCALIHELQSFQENWMAYAVLILNDTPSVFMAYYNSRRYFFTILLINVF